MNQNYKVIGSRNCPLQTQIVIKPHQNPAQHKMHRKPNFVHQAGTLLFNFSVFMF